MCSLLHAYRGDRRALLPAARGGGAGRARLSMLRCMVLDLRRRGIRPPAPRGAVHQTPGGPYALCDPVQLHRHRQHFRHEK
eukprot:COSAG02_NODE_60337_length_271_cov_1.191860_1_plen_81_part_10